MQPFRIVLRLQAQGAADGVELHALGPVEVGVLLGKLERMAGDKEAADLIAHIAIEISYADTYFNRAERMQFDAICGALGLEAKDYTEGLH